jgi:hypothetical protein
MSAGLCVGFGLWSCAAHGFSAALLKVRFFSCFTVLTGDNGCEMFWEAPVGHCAIPTTRAALRWPAGAELVPKDIYNRAAVLGLLRLTLHLQLEGCTVVQAAGPVDKHLDAEFRLELLVRSEHELPRGDGACKSPTSVHLYATTGTQSVLKVNLYRVSFICGSPGCKCALSE